MKKTLKKILVFSSMLFLFGNFFVPLHSILAQGADRINSNYYLLSPLPCDRETGATGIGDGYGPGCDDGQLKSIGLADNDILSKYLNLIIKLVIGLCAVLAVVMIVIGGIEYSTSELISNKAAGKERIQSALLGLLLALGSYMLLFTINPDLLKSDVEIGETELGVTISEFKIASIPVGGAINSGNAGSRGTVCDANVIFQGAQDSGHPISATQAQTLSCIGGAESGCRAIQANVPGVQSSAFGVFQIVLTMHGRLFDNPVCQAAAGVPAGTPLGCRSRSQLCYKAAGNLACQSAVAAQLLLRQTNYRDWLQTQAPCKNAMCVRESSPNTNLHISLGAISGRGAISDLSAYCNIR